jgi:hypothetical protein
MAMAQVGENPKGPPLRACSNIYSRACALQVVWRCEWLWHRLAQGHISCAPVPPFIAVHAQCRLCGAVRGCGTGGWEPQRPAAARLFQHDLAFTAHAHCRLCGAVRGCGAGGREPQRPAAVRLFHHFIAVHAQCRLCGAVRGTGGRKPQRPAAAHLFQHDPSYNCACALQVVWCCAWLWHRLVEIPRDISCVPVPPFIGAHLHCRLYVAVRGCDTGGPKGHILCVCSTIYSRACALQVVWCCAWLWRRWAGTPRARRCAPVPT